MTFEDAEGNWIRHGTWLRADEGATFFACMQPNTRAEPLVAPTPRILDGEQEAQLTKIACSTPPDGRSRWTLQMLADELVALDIVDSISADTVGRVQKKRVEAVA